jgi:hypothetical protein
MAGQTAQSHEHGGWTKLSPMDWRRRPALLTGAPK